MPRACNQCKCLGLIETLAEIYPEADWQRCTVHWYRNILKDVPKSKVKEVAAMLKAIHAQEDKDAALQKRDLVVEKLYKMKLGKASKHVAESAAETLSYMKYPSTHWKKIRTNNPMERVIREIRRRTRVIGAFPDGNSALMLVAARLRHIAGFKWGVKRDAGKCENLACNEEENFLNSSESKAWWRQLYRVTTAEAEI